MGNQSTKDYKFAEKNKWRLWAWRNIKQKLRTRQGRPIYAPQAKGAYLPSKSDKDRDIACRKFDFNKHNLIPIERDKKIVKYLRKTHKTVLHADVWGGLSLMQPGEIDFVHLDLCNGLTGPNRTGVDTFIRAAPLIPGGVFSINLLAGRDQRDFFYLEEAFEIPKEYKGHRGFLFLLNMILWDRDRYHQAFEGGKISSENLFSEEVLESLAQIAEWCEPQFNSYRSGNLRLDSVIFRCWMLTGHHMATLSWKEKKEKFNWTEENKKSAIKERSPWINYKAIRTQRINGTKAPSPVK